jgi:hypothetical protein
MTLVMNTFKLLQKCSAYDALPLATYVFRNYETERKYDAAREI